MSLDFLSNPELWLALLTLSALEIVLGIDNIIFLSIMAAKLPEHQQARARLLGLAGAMGTRMLLLVSLSWIARLVEPLFHLGSMAISGRDLILGAGGLFLVAKAGKEIREMLHPQAPSEEAAARSRVSFLGTIVQIAILDIVFSLDSVITAVGMTNNLPVMIAAIMIAVFTMMLFSGAVSRFVEGNPTIKMLALSFLVLVGAVLMAEGVDIHVSRAYIYFAMGFSTAVELLNIRLRRVIVGHN